MVGKILDSHRLKQQTPHSFLLDYQNVWRQKMITAKCDYCGKEAKPEIRETWNRPLGWAILLENNKPDRLVCPDCIPIPKKKEQVNGL
jgi:hypothetical protein